MNTSELEFSVNCYTSDSLFSPYITWTPKQDGVRSLKRFIFTKYVWLYLKSSLNTSMKTINCWREFLLIFSEDNIKKKIEKNLPDILYGLFGRFQARSRFFFSLFHINTKQHHRLIYRAELYKYTKFHKNPLQTHRDIGHECQVVTLTS